MKNITIRKLKPEDVFAAAELERKIFTRPWSCQGFLDAIAGERNIFLVAEEGSEILGYCGMYCAADEGEITNVAVDASVRRQQVGKKLMERLLKEAKAAGIRTVLLEVRISNEAAIRLYEGFGFSVCGIRKGFYDAPREDGYVMQLSQ